MGPPQTDVTRGATDPCGLVHVAVDSDARTGRDTVSCEAPGGPSSPVPPRRMRQRVAAGQLGGRGPGRPRPLTLRLFARSGHGLPASPGPLGHVDQRAEPRGRHARIAADHLEVLERPGRRSADFLHTRSSTAASPSAWVRSATSASSCSSRVEGPALPAANGVFPASRKSAFPSADRLLADLLPPSRLSDRHLAVDHAQHDPGLLLDRNGWGSSHVSDSPSGLTQLSCRPLRRLSWSAIS
jgi:hypothetical protein